MPDIQPYAECADNWEAVPARVRDLYVKYAHTADKLVRSDPEAGVWDFHTEEVGLVLVKRAEFFPWLGKTMRNVQIPLGGPNPLTAMLLGGALGAGVGGVGGGLASWLMPEYVGKDAWKRTALLGALGGAAIPGVLHGPTNVAEHGLWKGLTTGSELQGGPAYKNTADPVAAAEAKRGPLKAMTRTEAQAGGYGEHTRAAPEVASAYWKQLAADQDGPEKQNTASRFTGVVDRLAKETGLVFDDPFIKQCADIAGGSIPRIPTDEWGNAIMYDPFLSPPQKAVVAGLPFAAGAARGSRWVSPTDIARVAANAGLGAFFGKAIGAVAGPFLGLTPKAREGIQRAGLLAGAIKMLTGI